MISSHEHPVSQHRSAESNRGHKLKNPITNEPFFQLLLIALGAAVISAMLGYALSLIEQNAMIEAGMLPEYLELKQSSPFFYAAIGYGAHFYSRGDAIFVVGSLLSAALLALVVLSAGIHGWKSKMRKTALNQ